jgi:hypothetical protein
MTLELKIPSETEAKLRERAAAAGQDLETFVLQAVAEKLTEAESQPILPSRNGKDWRNKLLACIDLHPVVTHFVDDSRESIYAGRGE